MPYRAAILLNLITHDSCLLIIFGRGIIVWSFSFALIKLFYFHALLIVSYINQSLLNIKFQIMNFLFYSCCIDTNLSDYYNPFAEQGFEMRELFIWQLFGG